MNGIFDAHSDLFEDVLYRRLNGETDIFNRLHLERYRKGNIEGSLFVVFIDPPFLYEQPAARTELYLEAARAEIAQCDAIRIVYNSKDILQAKKDGKIYILIGVEGMAAMGNDIAWLDRYYDFGARHGMLTWNEANSLGAGASSGESYGLTALGKEVVRRMQEKKMIVDVSHLNEAGFWDIANMASAPFIASHSNCRKLCDVPRNLTDEQLRAIRDVGGVVGLNAYSPFTDADPQKQTVERLAEHAAHMIDIMGIDHVGCGFDFFEFVEKPGIPAKNENVKGMSDCSETGSLFDCFDRMGMSKEDQEKIARGNFLRVVEAVLG